MTSNIETRKLHIIESLVGLNNEHVIRLIEALLQSESGFWQELTDEQKARVEKAIEGLDAGRGIPHESVVGEFRKKYGS